LVVVGSSRDIDSTAERSLPTMTADAASLSSHK
jgi:hypothetical protein